MKEQLSAVILAAGQGTRMLGTLGVPKPLAPVNHEPLLLRNLRQLHENGVNDIILVTGYRAQEVEDCATELFPETRFIRNPRFMEDKNILSTILGMGAVKAGRSALLVEGDVIFSDSAIARLVNEPALDRNYWSACGHFKSGQKGGILRQSGGQIEEIRYAEWNPELAGWYKNLGAIHLGYPYRSAYLQLAEKYASRDSNQYFMQPWMENLSALPSFLLDLGEAACSFNTPSEYESAEAQFTSDRSPLPIELADWRDLRHVEGFDQNRAAWLARKIARDGVWTTPVAISREGIVMDGQHRLEAAKILKLDKIPVVIFDYRDISVFSLRPEMAIDVDSILQIVAEGKMYPYKTVKHAFPAFPECSIPLASLGMKMT